ncbi:carboxymuconolactone decarboxylase family protein [Variovorax guangxiensis]|uniref:carboxymuconolactone decarboxylase family protein n=1 Tax=Variovorax guangxiensis TaxID=1775474 RepID=UPI00285563B9|nr:carboxymuconolactone decarboxylase family protein [Variovorax guangxiensis]MDR6861537.1 alkylhydroperoxidase/carboxymuconolactone decarboxylase family protein YurZ [Variovorax guangxiensis]
MNQIEDPNRLKAAIGDPSAVDRIRGRTPSSFDAASGFWSTITQTKHLSPRLRELILLALHASSSSLNEKAVGRHVVMAKDAGATEEDILDVLLSIVGLANHAMYFAVPTLLDEYKKMGREDDASLPDFLPDMEAIRDDFIRTRGFWNEQRDQLARLMPGYFTALSRLSMEPWKNGALAPGERELVYIAIDCSITHMHEGGLRMHIRNATRHNVTRDQILETFQLCALMGMESYILGCQALGQTSP